MLRVEWRGLGVGRWPQFDERSRSFAAPAVEPPRTVLWDHIGPVLDQRDLGACTGFAMAQACNTRPTHKPRGRLLTDADGRKLYSRATELDPFPGVWPPTDTGSSGLAVCKAAMEAGLITRYEWAFGLDHMLAALQPQLGEDGKPRGGPVLMGTWWYESMFTPNRNGFVVAEGERVGGHEYLVIGCNMRSEYLTVLNTWGPRWGRRGRFRLPFTVGRRLLREDGDAVRPIR